MIGHSYYLVTCSQYVQMVMHSVMFVCVCATKKTSIYTFTGHYLHENSACHSLTLCMSPKMFARSTESHREHYSQHFYSHDSPLPRVTGSSVIVNSPLTVLSEHEYVFCGTLVYTMSNGWVEKCSH